jgi:hypothetical protein
MGATSGAGMSNPLETPKFIPVFCGVVQSLGFLVVFCKSLFILLSFFFLPL